MSDDLSDYSSSVHDLGQSSHQASQKHLMMMPAQVNQKPLQMQNFMQPPAQIH
jgi:hypothetical protein